MTVSQGYPDYSRLTPWSDQIFINDTGVTHASGFAYPRMYMANVRALLFNIQPGSGALAFSFRWYTDAVTPNSFKSTQISVGQSQTATRTIRPLGPYLDIAVVSNAGGNVTYNLLLATTADTPLPMVDDNSPILINQLAIPIAATTTTTVNALNWWCGQAYAQAFTSGTNWQWTLKVTDYQGLTHQVAAKNQVTGIAGMYVFVPSGIVSMDVSNSDAAPKTFWAYLIGDPSTIQ